MTASLPHPLAASLCHPDAGIQPTATTTELLMEPSLAAVGAFAGFAGTVAGDTALLDVESEALNAAYTCIDPLAA